MPRLYWTGLGKKAIIAQKYVLMHVLFKGETVVIASGIRMCKLFGSQIVGVPVDGVACDCSMDKRVLWLALRNFPEPSGPLPLRVSTDFWRSTQPEAPNIEDVSDRECRMEIHGACWGSLD